jgi:hypothetical protein
MPLTDEERLSKIKEIVALKATGEYKCWEDASVAAGMGKKWYFKNKDFLKEPIKETPTDTKCIQVLPNEPISAVKITSVSKSNKRSRRVMVPLNEEKYQYYKAKAEDRCMDLSQLLAFAIGEAADNDLI